MIKISDHDHLRDAALHAHADMRVAIKLLRKLRWIKAWRKMHQGYDRLGKALESPRRQHEEQPMGAAMRR
ncbi:MAG: hypothetical protein ACYC0O_09200 [Desulfurivibrionaceae bacterium]